METYSGDLRESASSKENKKEYRLEGSIPVEVEWKEFLPKPETESSESVESKKDTVVFLPGWAMGSQNKAIEGLCQTFSDVSGNPAFAVTSRAEQAAADDGEKIDFLHEEARAIAEMIKEQGLSDVVLTGHSQGADKAIHLSVILKSQNVAVKGIILLSAVGLYDQHPAELTASFVADSVITTALGEMQINNEVNANIAKEMWRSKAEYLSRLFRETEEMARLNPYAAQVDVPVVLMSGTGDPVSNPAKILWSKKDGEDRELFLKEHLFPNSPYVKMVTPDKEGHHKVPLTRAESTAKASLYLIDRAYRSEDKNPNSIK